MHDDRELVEGRIRRELWERVLPLVHRDRRPMDVAAGPDPDHLEPFSVGTPWGPPWGTTWFRLRGDVPSGWVDGRVEAVVDLGFNRAPAGFQCEGMVVRTAPDGSTEPVQGIHPNRTNIAVPAVAGPVEVLVEAASNPSFPQFRPSLLGSPATAGDAPLYTFRQADLVLVDATAEALVHDLDVLAGIMHSLPLRDARRARLLRVLEAALDDLAGGSPREVERARERLAPELGDAGTVDRHHVVATGHAHIDTAWLWPTSETVRKCTRTFASAVALMDDDPDYRFACSQAQQYAWIAERHPALFESIRERVDRGQWVPVGGMWVEADMNLPSGESLVRQIVFGQRWFEEHLGRRCTEVWIPDVFGYPAGLPQVFAAGGMRRFVTQKLSWNKQNRFPHHTFWWEGLDGTRVLTHFPPVDTYNAEVTPAELARSVDNFRDHGWSAHSLMPFGYGDGGGGPTREMLERAHRLAAADTRATVELGTPAEFFDRIEAEAVRGAPIPIWRGELYFETHRGTLTSQLRTKIGNRRCERLLVEAELWAATAGRSADLDRAWREVLTQQFHDILPGSSIAWVHADAEEVFTRVEREVTAEIESSLAALAGPAPVVANPADVAIDEIAVFTGSTMPAGDGPVQTLADGSIAARVTAPALGVAALEAEPVADRVVVTESSMTNGRLAVRWDTTGALDSVVDVARARELLPAERSAAVLELAPDRPVEYDAWDLESWTRRHARPLEGPVEIEVLDDGPLVGRARVTRCAGPSTFTIVYELRAGERQLRIGVDVDWHHDEHLLSIAFPLDVRADTAACDVQFGVVHRPTHPSSPWDAAKFEVCAHRFVDLAEPGFGVAVINDGRYGHHVFDGAVRVSLARAAKYPDPGADHGRHSVQLALRPHDAGLADVRAAAARLNRPLRVVAASPTGGDPPDPLVRLTGSDGGPALGIEVDAVKSADDGSGDLVVRLHEACGDRARVTVAAGSRIGSAWRCDLLEEPVRGEEAGDGVVVITLRPFELVTLRLRLVDDFDGRRLDG